MDWGTSQSTVHLSHCYLNIEAFMRRLTLWMLLLSGLSTAVIAVDCPTTRQTATVSHCAT